MHNYLSRTITTLCLMLVSFASGNETVKILGIGNSFTLNATKYLPEIAAENTDCSILVGVAYIGGCPIKKHRS